MEGFEETSDQASLQARLSARPSVGIWRRRTQS